MSRAELCLHLSTIITTRSFSVLAQNQPPTLPSTGCDLTFTSYAQVHTTCTATDPNPSSSPNNWGVVTYSISGTAPFAIDYQTAAVLSLCKSSGDYSITLVATDGGGLTAQQDITLTCALPTTQSLSMVST